MITRNYGLVGAAILLGGMVLTGCGTTAPPVASASSHQSHTVSPSPAASPPTSSTTPSSRTSTTTSTTPSSSSESSHTGSVSPSSSSISLSPITYTTKQQATIYDLGHSVGFPAAYVPRQGFQSKFVQATTFIAATSHKGVLMLTYNNFTVQESGSANSFGTGGDHVTTGTVALTIPGSGSRTPIQ
ncbi:MAG: hypothetical protein C7B46_18650, partial [Sulfobacillus benefaciens]